jgi:hypothetical protein
VKSSSLWIIYEPCGGGAGLGVLAAEWRYFRGFSWPGPTFLVVEVLGVCVLPWAGFPAPVVGLRGAFRLWLPDGRLLRGIRGMGVSFRNGQEGSGD